MALTPLVYLVLLPGSLCCSPARSRSASFVVHYHIDWLKEQITHRNELTTQDPGFWHALGTDQLVHGLTYLGIVAVLMRRVLEQGRDFAIGEFEPVRQAA